MDKNTFNERQTLLYLDCLLDESLRKYTRYMNCWYERLKISFSKQGPLSFTPEKAYTAKTVVDILEENKGQEVGKMHVLVFYPGDGTGDSSTYSLDQIKIPKRLQFEVKPEKVLPRAKKCDWEAMMPFGTLIKNVFYENIISLEELTVNNNENQKTLVVEKTLGLSKEKHQGLLSAIKKHEAVGIKPPRHYYTTGVDSSGKRFGDPHSIFSPNRRNIETVQMVGFIAYETDSILYRVFDKAVNYRYGNRSA